VPREVVIALTSDVMPRLARLADSSDVWLLNTPETERATALLRARSGHGQGSVTLFNSSGDLEADLAWLIEEVELHHGLASEQKPPMEIIRVIGAPPTSRMRSALEAYNFTDIADEPDGFVARWVAPA
jgi:hypothetical protein